MKNLEKRKIELKRQSKITQIEADCIDLKVGENISVKMPDLQMYQRLRLRVMRLRRDKIMNLHKVKIRKIRKIY